jgi:hypothetical protein
LTALLLSSCATEIVEQDFYTDRGEDGAVITHFFSDASSDISKQAWDSIREGMTCVSETGIGNLKTEIESLCSRVSCAQVSTESTPSSSEMVDFRKAVFRLKSAVTRITDARRK